MARPVDGRPSRRVAGTAAVVAVTAAVSILAAIAATDDSPKPAGHGLRAAASPSPTLTGGAAARALTERFGVFRLPRGVADDIAPRARGALSSEFFADQAHLAANRGPIRGPGRATDTDVFIAGGPHDTVCLLVLPPGAAGPGGQCTPAGVAASGRSVVTQERRSEEWPSQVEIYGVVPDGIERVKVTLDDGTTTILPVSANTYSAALPGPARTVSYTAPDGPVTVSASS